MRSHFRSELNVYESTLAQWIKFAVGLGQSTVFPTGLEIEADGSFWLLHEVKDTEQAITCSDGTVVRCLKFGLADRVETVH